MTFNGKNIIFLESDDFINNTLIYKNKPVKGKWFVMVQGSFCGYCTQAKPDFCNAAETLQGKAVFATVQIDGNNQEQKLKEMLPSITNVNLGGVPAYLLFENGKFIAVHTGGRKHDNLIEFLQL